MGAAATGAPLLPPGYVAGTITISAGQANTPQQLLSLIQTQLDPNCPGAARAVTITYGNATIFVGRASPNGGALSSTNFGRTLAAATVPNTIEYGSYFPGAAAPIGDIQVFMAAGTFNVEVLV